MHGTSLQLGKSRSMSNTELQPQAHEYVMNKRVYVVCLSGVPAGVVVVGGERKRRWRKVGEKKV